MKITEVLVEGYKSFEKVQLSDLGKLVILIGKNGSGKSNLLELLEFFFRDLDALPQKALGAANEHLWRGFEIGAPILVHVTVEVDGDVLAKALPKEFQYTPEKVERIEITRTVEQSGGNMEWRTQSLGIGPRTIVVDGVVRKPDELLPLVPEPGLGESIHPKPALPADLPAKVLQGVSQTLLARFQMVPSSRNRQFTASSGSATRASVLDDQTLTQVQTLAQLVKPGERKRKFNPLQRSIKEIIPSAEGISAPQGQVFIQEGRLEVPLSLTGGGVQEVVNVLCRIQALHEAREGSVIGIEEPESHLHPDAMKLLLTHLMGEDAISQFWLTTQSPFLVDRTELQNVWLVTKINGTSSIARLTDPQSLRRAFLDLGIRPSDVLYSDAILLAEGDSDVEFYRGMALKMGFPEIEFVSMIPTGGVPQERHHLEMWADISKKSGLPVFLLLDGDARGELDEVIHAKLVDPRKSACLTGSLEDQYPRDKLVNALKDEFDLDVKETAIPTSKVTAFLETELHAAKKDKRSWKKRLAARMVKLMDPQEAPEQLRSFLHSLRAELSGPTSSR